MILKQTYSGVGIQEYDAPPAKFELVAEALGFVFSLF